MSFPEQIDLPLPGGVSLPVRRIVDAGELAEFWMGSRGNFAREEPVHRVRISAPYYLGETPVTQRQYRAMANACLDNLSKLKSNRGADPSHFKTDDRPVEQVDWRDAEVVCGWLSESKAFRDAIVEVGLPDTWRIGLPNEAQWEYACRAGTDSDYWSGDGEAALGEVGCFVETFEEGTQVTGGNPANDFGLQDLHGNVWEWCADVFDSHAYAKREDSWEARAWTDDDAGKDADSEYSNDRTPYRVVRGGSWVNGAKLCRSPARGWDGAGRRHRRLGFRACLFPGPVVAATRAGEAAD